MKFKYILPFVIAGLFITAVFSFQGKIIKSHVTIKKLPTGDAPANLKEMFFWDFLRLRDPSTGKIPDNIRQASLAYAQTLPGSLTYMKNNKNHILADNWNLRGPVNIGGRTRALALDVLDEHIIIAGGVSGGMWRSTNSGITWQKTTRPDQLQSTSCIAQDIRKGKEKTWYLGTGEYFNIYGGLRGDGIYKSTDGGLSWFPLESTVSNTPQTWDNGFDYVWNIVTDHTEPTQDVILAATAVGAIQRSTDGGNNWKTVLGGFGNTNSWFTDLVISPAGVFYAALSQRTFNENASSVVKGIYRSQDGITWKEITPEFMPTKYNRIVIAIAPSDENQVYFLGETPYAGTMTLNSQGDSLWHSIWKYTYKSGDGSGDGGLWEDRSLGVPAPARLRSQFNSQGGYDLVIKVKPDNPDVVFIGGSNLYRSTDGFLDPTNVTHIGGYCWDDTSCYEIYTYTNHHADEHAIVFLPSDPNVMFTGSDGGVAVTYNNMKPHVDWESLNSGYFTTQYYTCAIDHATEGSSEIIGGLQDNGTLLTTSIDKNAPWINAAGADGFHSAIADNAEFYYTSNNASRQPFIKIWRKKIDKDGKILVSTRVDPDGASDMIWNTPFKLDPNDTRRMYLAGGSILWRNNNLDLIPVADNKDSTKIAWDSLSFTRLDSIDPESFRGERITALAVSKIPANIVYYGTSYGRLFRLNNADKGNPVPIEITWNKFPKSANVGCVAIDPHDANKIFVVFTNFVIQSIFYSEDGGQNWKYSGGNLEQYANGGGAGPAVFWVEILPISGKNLYFAGTSTGLYSTAFLDGEYTVWQQEAASSIGNAMIYMLDSREKDGYVVASTFGVGMYSANFTSLPSAPEAPKLTYPANDTTGILDKITLRWSPSEGADLYLLQVSPNANFDTIFYEIDGLRNLNSMVVDMKQGLMKYYWRVFARGAGGKSSASETGTFITAVSPPVMVYPEDNATDLIMPFNLKWDSAFGADSYHLKISGNALFSNIVKDTITNLTEYYVSELANNTRYYWKISSINNGQEGLLSKSGRFKTKEVIGVHEDLNLSDLISIEDIAPNPASDNTMIRFFMKKEDEISVILFEGTGKTIKTLVNGKYAKGEHFLQINCRNLSNGAYYLVFKLKNIKKIKHFLLVK